MEMFKYAFMQRAFIVGILLAAVIPCIGIVVVCKRLSMIGDALSHTSLAGVAIGLILGINPVFTASVTCVLAALGMEGIRRKLPRFSEMSIAITMSAGIGLAGVLSGFVKNTANFNRFLFWKYCCNQQRRTVSCGQYLYGSSFVVYIVLQRIILYIFGREKC